MWAKRAAGVEWPPLDFASIRRSSNGSAAVDKGLINFALPHSFPFQNMKMIWCFVGGVRLVTVFQEIYHIFVLMLCIHFMFYVVYFSNLVFVFLYFISSFISTLSFSNSPVQFQQQVFVIQILEYFSNTSFSNVLSFLEKSMVPLLFEPPQTSERHSDKPPPSNRSFMTTVARGCIQKGKCTEVIGTLPGEILNSTNRTK